MNVHATRPTSKMDVHATQKEKIVVR